MEMPPPPVPVCWRGKDCPWHRQKRCFFVHFPVANGARGDEGTEPPDRVDHQTAKHSNIADEIPVDHTLSKLWGLRFAQLASRLDQQEGTTGRISQKLADMEDAMGNTMKSLARCQNDIDELHEAASNTGQVHGRLEPLLEQTLPPGLDPATRLSQLEQKLEQVQRDARTPDEALTQKVSAIGKDVTRLKATKQTTADKKVAELASAIGKLEADFARLDAEKKDATAVRDKEHAGNMKTNAKKDGHTAEIKKLSAKFDSMTF